MKGRRGGKEGEGKVRRRRGSEGKTGRGNMEKKWILRGKRKKKKMAGRGKRIEKRGNKGNKR